MTPKNIPELFGELIDNIMLRESTRDENFKEFYSFVCLWIAGLAGLGATFVNGWLAFVIGILWCVLCYKHLRRIF